MDIMRVDISPKVKKYLDKLNEPHYGRIEKAIDDLELNPPKGDIKAMGGKRSEYRLRIGNYRLLFKIADDLILIHDIGLRGQVYKKR